MKKFHDTPTIVDFALTMQWTLEWPAEKYHCKFNYWEKYNTYWTNLTAIISQLIMHILQAEISETNTQKIWHAKRTIACLRTCTRISAIIVLQHISR